MNLPELLHQWLIGRSFARGIPLPVADRGGWRVDTGTANEPRRYVFAEPGEHISALAATIADPGIPLKLCTAPEVLARLVPAGWTVIHSGTMMTGPAEPAGAHVLPPGFVLEHEVEKQSGSVRVLAPDRALAASGYCGWSATHFVYDRIVTAAEWQRRGLGRAVMLALAGFEAARSRAQVLVATDMGRALYLSLGWSDVCPYSTATSGPATSPPAPR